MKFSHDFSWRTFLDVKEWRRLLQRVDGRLPRRVCVDHFQVFQLLDAVHQIFFAQSISVYRPLQDHVEKVGLGKTEVLEQLKNKVDEKNMSKISKHNKRILTGT